MRRDGSWVEEGLCDVRTAAGAGRGGAEARRRARRRRCRGAAVPRRGGRGGAGRAAMGAEALGCRGQADDWCGHGTCANATGGAAPESAPWRCACDEGWTGSLADFRLERCVMQSAVLVGMSCCGTPCC